MNNTQTPADHSPCIRVRPSWFRAWRAAGYLTDSQIAESIGLTRNTIARVQGGGDCSSRVIARSMIVLGVTDFARLFKVEAR